MSKAIFKDMQLLPLRGFGTHSNRFRTIAMDLKCCTPIGDELVSRSVPQDGRFSWRTSWRPVMLLASGCCT